EPYSLTRLTAFTNFVGGETVATNYAVSYPDGATEYYGFIPTTTLDGHKFAFLTDRIDPHGITNHFVYIETNSLVLLLVVFDGDGRSNTLHYADVTHPNLITSVTDPFGRTAFLNYDTNSTDGVLTNVIDPQGLSSFFKYDSQGWATNLIT